MPKALIPSSTFKAILRKRRWIGADRLDEVWNGTYVMSPDPDNLHQRLATRLAVFLGVFLDPPFHASVLMGVNVSDRTEKWSKNYRVPDVSVFLPGNPAEDRVTHWLGGPDIAVEVVSPGDRSRAKLAFYASVGIRELWVIDRKPWSLELYRLDAGALVLSGRATVEIPTPLASAVLPFTMGLRDDVPRPWLVLETEPPAEPRSQVI